MPRLVLYFSQARTIGVQEGVRKNFSGRQEGGRRVAEKFENHAFRIFPFHPRQDGGVKGIR